MKKGTALLSLILLLIAPLALTACTKTSEPTTDETVQVVETSDKLAEISGESLYEIDSETSVLGYSAKKIASDPHVGTVAISEGQVTLTDGVFTGGSFVIDMNAISESKNSEGFLKHIKGADFFDITTYPTAKLVITGLQKAGDKFVVKGDLTIKDQTNAVEFPATAVISETGVSAQADFSIDRTKWGIIYNSGNFVKDLGDKAIEDEIHFTLDLNLEIK